MLKKYFEKRNKFRCPYCQHEFAISNFWLWLACPHIFDTYRSVKCPRCKVRNWVRRRL